MKTLSLRTKLLVLLVGLIMLTVATVVIATLYKAGNEVVNQTERQLDVGTRVLAQVLANREQQLLSSAAVLTEDFGFKQAVASSDKETIISALENHGNRIHANLMLLIGLDGNLIASTSTIDDSSIASLHALAEQASNSGSSGTEILMQGELYQILLLPVRAPALIGWVGIGFKLDASIANNLKELTRLEVTITSRNINITDSSINTRKYLLTTVNPPIILDEIDQTELARMVRSSSSGYLNRVIPISEIDDTKIEVILSASIETALTEYRELRWAMFWIGIISTLLATISVWLLANRLANPLNALADAARRIAAGEYGQKVEVKAKTREIDELSESLNQMQLEIASREEHILFQAAHDTLTGLLNRTELAAQLDRCLQIQNQAWALICINIDHFRQVNDTFGHVNGDFTLRSVGQRLRELLLPPGLAARLGADEFLLLMPLRSAEDSKTTIASLRARLSAPFQVGDINLPLSFSLGVALSPQHGTDGEVLLRRAHIALDLARSGKETIAHYEPGLDEARLLRIRMLNDLKRAVAAGNQFILYYQPKLELSTGRVPHAEALLRWIHPNDGMVRPDLFIPLAEQSGLIRAITHWVIREAVLQVRRWLDEGVEMGVSLNLSAQDLNTEDAVKILQDALQQNSVSPALITCEITESTAMENPHQALTILQQLRKLGVRLSIDDFGTGYSSMAQLRHLPVDELKIDKGFVLKLDRQPDDQTIVRTTIELGHNFGLKVVAEGVENVESLAILRRLGCDYAQGFHLSKPIPPAALADWWRNNSLIELPRAEGY